MCLSFSCSFFFLLLFPNAPITSSISSLHHSLSLLLLLLQLLLAFELFLQCLDIPRLSLVCIHPSLVLPMFPSILAAVVVCSICTFTFIL